LTHLKPWPQDGLFWERISIDGLQKTFGVAELYEHGNEMNPACISSFSALLGSAIGALHRLRRHG
jgi:hypothetical protein